MQAFPFSSKDVPSFWNTFAKNNKNNKNNKTFQEQFPYLSLTPSILSFPSYIYHNTITETNNTTQPIIIENIQFLPFSEPNELDKTKTNHSYFNYDMTKYINNQDLRYKDSIYMSRIFDKLWLNFKNNKDNYSTDYQDIPFESTFHGSRRCLQFLHTPTEIFFYYFKMCKINPPTTLNDILSSSLQIVIPFFSHLKAYIHGHIDELPPISYCYTELDTIAGYPEEKNRALTDDPVNWLSVDVDDQHNPQWWANNITTILIKSQIINKDPLISFYEFLKCPWLWVTDGASTVSKLILNGQKVRSKFGAALSLTPNELLASVIHALNPKIVNIDIFIKQDERGFKRRLIANMDLGSYLIAAYIRYLIEWLDGPVPSWMTATTNPNKDKQVMDLLRLKHTAMPLDESQFDHHLSRNAWRGFLKSLDFIFPNNFGVHLFHVLFQNSIFFDRITNSRGPWIKGMPSGLAITSLGNTLFNYVKQIAIMSPIHYALGDDVLIFSDGYTLKQISQYYTTFGAEVNVKKNWTSQHYAEYLHFLYCQHGRVGLPARIYGSLMYGLQFKDVTPLQRLNELTMLFKDFYDRAVLHFDFNLVASDLSRAVSSRWAGFNTMIAKTWLHIPKALNGFGFLPYNNYAFIVKNKETIRQRYHNSLYPIPDKVTVLSSSWSLQHFKLTSAQYHTGNIFHLPPIQNMQDWINRLNFNVPGISKIIQQYATETIPLPELEFISTSRMSAFASQFKYNAYPNLSGNAVSRTTRFIKASLALADQVVSWLKKYSIYVYV